MEKILSKYAGECLALVNDKVVASGINSIDVYQSAKKLYPGQIITIFRVPRKREVITFL